MHREAEMIEQQAKAKQAGGAAAAPAAMAQTAAAAPIPGVPAAAPAAAAPAAGAGQPDYSAQWAEYYRSIGKMKEAEAIEAQMKSKVSQYDDVIEDLSLKVRILFLSLLVNVLKNITDNIEHTTILFSSIFKKVCQC